MSEGNGLTVYHPRQPQQSPLWRILDKDYASFEQEFEQKYRKTYGYRRPVVDDVVRDDLKCGDLREGLPACAATTAVTNTFLRSAAKVVGSAERPR